MRNPGPRKGNAGPDSVETAIGAAQWIGADPTREQIYQLEQYRSWLVKEAIVAGGIGPNEGHRIWKRHIADSLIFGHGLANRLSCLDIGSGVGLPGVPLAIINPQTDFDLVDKSGRRCDLLRRAIRVLGLQNCAVIHRSLDSLEGRYPFVVSRAAIPAKELMIHVKHLLEPGGVANISVSRAGDSPWTAGLPAGLRAETVSVPDKILDTKVQLLRIEAIQNGS
ncbi:MAG: class I SAM-dependent methyltransferase [Acidimicrobiia bacterium]|nr:class I SAM-dependent methyltransferase [Acidimicrobiia bacterium]